MYIVIYNHVSLWNIMSMLNIFTVSIPNHVQCNVENEVPFVTKCPHYNEHRKLYTTSVKNVSNPYLLVSICSCQNVDIIVSFSVYVFITLTFIMCCHLFLSILYCKFHCLFLPFFFFVV